MRSQFSSSDHPILKGFIVFEGLDGSGTTTQVRLLSEKLTEKGIPVWTTCEPTDRFIGKNIRKVLRGEEKIEPPALALLFAADRYDHIYNPSDGIITHIDKAEWVLCDR
ncbi:MAG: dTMP kinase, partial [Spirochaetota bacterium]